MAALEILRKNQAPQGLVAARQILGGKAPTPLTIAAIATLGELGNQEDIAFLQSHPQATEPRYAAVTASTLQKLLSH